jgi:hypothetical protein
MPRPTKKANRKTAKRPSRLTETARQVAVDADRVRQDLNKLLLSLEDLSVEALRAVSSRALELIEERTGVRKRSMVGSVISSAVSVGETVAGLFSRSETTPRTDPTKKRASRTGKAARNKGV